MCVCACVRGCACIQTDVSKVEFPEPLTRKTQLLGVCDKTSSRTNQRPIADRTERTVKSFVEFISYSFSVLIVFARVHA